MEGEVIQGAHSCKWPLSWLSLLFIYCIYLLHFSGLTYKSIIHKLTSCFYLSLIFLYISQEFFSTPLVLESYSFLSYHSTTCTEFPSQLEKDTVNPDNNNCLLSPELLIQFTKCRGQCLSLLLSPSLKF